MVAVLIVGIVMFAIGVYVGYNMRRWFGRRKNTTYLLFE